MDPKVPLYISAVSLVVAIIASLFLFNIIQKTRKSVKDIQINNNKFVSLANKVDTLNNELISLQDRYMKLKQLPTVSPSPVEPIAVPTKQEKEKEQEQEITMELPLEDDEDSENEEDELLLEED